jgi:hypothetical protein
MSDVHLFDREGFTWYISDLTGKIRKWSPNEFSIYETPSFLNQKKATKNELMCAHTDWIGTNFTLPQWKKCWMHHLESFTFIGQNASSSSVRVLATKIANEIDRIGAVRPPKRVFDAIKKYLQIQRYRQNRLNDTNSATLFASTYGSSVAHEHPSKEACAICLNELGMEYRFLDCNHTFHWSCVQQWKEVSNKDSCPLCRAKIWNHQ